MKTCSTCKVNKPLSAFFKQAKSTDGLQHSCKDCQSARKKKYNADNRDRVLATIRAYDQQNMEKKLAWREVNAAKVRAYYKKYYQAHKASWDNKRLTRRARILDAGASSLPVDTGDLLFSRQNGWCACCGADLSETGYHIDHVIPLAEGGSNHLDNLQLLTPSCNLAKGTRDWWVYLAARVENLNQEKGE